MVPSATIVLLLLAAGICCYRKRNYLKVKEQETQPMQEKKVNKAFTKKIDDENFGADYCEVGNVENVEMNNLYINAPGVNSVTVQMRMAELENDYTCII